MGEAADRKVAEMQATRDALEADLKELEERIPSPLRSVKSLIGLIVASSALTLFILERVVGKRSKRQPATEVVIRVVRED